MLSTKTQPHLLKIPNPFFSIHLPYDIFYRLWPLPADDKRNVFPAGKYEDVLERIYAPVQ